MGWVEKLTAGVNGIFAAKFETSEQQEVPSTSELQMTHGATKLDATFMCGGLVGFADIAAVCPWPTTAKIIRAYLGCAVTLIHAYGGRVMNLESGRIVSVFAGDFKNSNATMCARELHWCTEHILRPRALAIFESVRDNSAHLKQACGVDCGTAVAVRAGIREENDLLWIGKAPLFSARLADSAEHPYCTCISEASYQALVDKGKYDKLGHIWETREIEFEGRKEVIYCCKRYLRP